MALRRAGTRRRAGLLGKDGRGLGAGTAPCWLLGLNGGSGTHIPGRARSGGSGEDPSPVEGELPFGSPSAQCRHLQGSVARR